MAGDERATVLTRVRYRLENQFALAVGALVVLTLLTGYVAVATHTAPATTTEQREVASWSANGSFDHQATVQNDSLAFPLGETVHNRTLYYTRVTPELEGAHSFTYTGDAEDVDVSTDVTLVTRSVDRTGDRTVVLWSRTESLGSSETSALSAGEAHTAAFEVNVSQRQALFARVERELGTSIGSREVLVVAETDVNATLAGEERSLTRTDRLHLEPTDRFYRVEAAIQEGQGDTVTEEVAVPVERDLLPAYGAPLVAVLALVGALSLVYLDREGRLTLAPDVRTELERTRERDRFDEWISAGRATIDEDDRVIEIESLEGLVDVAIDANERVIYDDIADRHLVIDGDVIYRHAEGATDDGWTGVGDGSGGRDSHDPDGGDVDDEGRA